MRNVGLIGLGNAGGSFGKGEVKTEVIDKILYANAKKLYGL